MRLLNTRTLHFKEFLGDEIPPYAILSHVWSAQELRFEDFIEGRGKNLYGFEKVIKLCELSQSYKDEFCVKPLEFCWIDTVCIDKRSSAELTEAINSMYAWYERAKVCFVFLPDVRPFGPETLLNSHATSYNGAPFFEVQFLESKWFQRGFTLQALIAPPNVLFCNTEYRIIGQKGVALNGVRPLTDPIQKASGVGISSLLGRLSDDPRGACIAQKMSWASKRHTTRPEDIAYCLLSIFSVNLPLLHGEGAANAFRRLQEAIIAIFTDESIFAWEMDDPLQPWSGLLAPHPRVFWNCHDMYTVRNAGSLVATTYAVTQGGLELTMSVDKSLRPRSTTTWCYLYPLSCFRLRKPWYRCYLEIWVEEVTMDGRQYADGFKLAWRSGVITIEYDEPILADIKRPSSAAISQEHEAIRQALGWSSPSLLNFNSREEQLYALSLRHVADDRPPAIEKKRSWFRRLSSRRVDATPPTSERPNLVKLYFKTHFTKGETPIATALLRSLT